MGLFYFWQRNTSRVFIRTETGIHPVLGIDAAFVPTWMYLRRVCELILELSLIDLDKALTLDDLY